jgi:hypothetical protein
MTTIQPVSPIASVLTTDPRTNNAGANSNALTFNTDPPAAPGSGMLGLIDLFANKTQSAGTGPTANLWLSHVTIPTLNSPLDDES